MADAERPAPNADLPDMDDWRRLVALKGGNLSGLASKTIDGVRIEPLYERRREQPPFLPRDAGSWTIIQLADDSDPDRANHQARQDIQGGATGLALSFASGPLAGTAGLNLTADALAAALEEIDFAAIHLRIEPHARGPDLARILQELVAGSGVAPELASIAFGLDPISPFAYGGSADGPDTETFTLRFRELRAAGFAGTLAVADGRVFHEAGASEAQELAAILGSAAWWLRALAAVGESAAPTLPFFGAGIAVDRDQFLSIAKLRALRLLWQRLQELCAARPVPLRIHAATSRRMMTRADPHTNLLRTTIAAVAAVAGGADTLAILPHDAATVPSQPAARALARNIQHLLMAESQMHRVADPAAGSGAFEALTSDLAERSWREFQAIEGEGGIVASLQAGAFQSRIAKSREALAAHLAAGRSPLVGASIFRDAAAAPIANDPARDVAAAGLAPIWLEDMARLSA